MKIVPNLKPTLKHLLVFMVMLVAFQSNASHVAGGDMSYKCIGLRKWEVTLVVYRDCSGIPMLGCSSGSQTGCTKTLTVKPMATVAGGGLNPNACVAPVPSFNVTVTSFKIVRIMQDAQSVCGASAKNHCTNNGTSASGSYSPAIEAFHYKGILDMSDPTYAAANVCPYWQVSWEECCRNSPIVNISNPGGTNFYTSVTINIHHNQSTTNFKNSSPEFKNEAVIVVCSSVEQSINAGAIDPDGDSLTYRITKSKGTGGVDVSYTSPWSEYKPFPMNSGQLPHTLFPQPNGPYVILDSTNGTIGFNASNSHPTNLIYGQLNVEVFQWAYANGLPFIVGITQRDIQYIVRSCPANVPPKFTTNPTLQNGNPKYNWSICAGEELCFTVTAKDDDDGPGPMPSSKTDTTLIKWDNSIVRPGKLSFAPDYDTTNPAARPREDRWKFCWQTELSDGRILPYYFTVTVMDNHCPNIGHITKAFSVTVLPKPLVSDSLFNDGCGKFRFEVNKLDLKQTFTSARLDITKEPNDFTFAQGSFITTSSNPNPTGVGPKLLLADTVAFNKPGKYLIKYQVLTSINCPTLIVYDTITIYPGILPTVTLTTQLDTVCKNVPTLTLVGSPAGGVFSGNAIDSLGVINIQSATIFANNNYIYKYKYVDSSNTCADSVTKTIFVRPNIVAAITAQDTVCKNVTSLKLIGNPVGGVFSGTATDSSGLINVQHANISANNSYTFQYKYSNNYGCIDSSTKTVFVKPNIQTLLTSTKDTVCKNVTPFVLSASPAGGVFSGTAINGNSGVINIQHSTILPNTTHTYKYKYSNAFGCLDSTTKTVFIVPNLKPIISSIKDTVCKNVTPFVLTGSPVGGIFIGAAIDSSGNIQLQNNAVNPNVTHVYKYKYSNTYGCADSNTKAIFVKPNVQSLLSTTLDTVCKNVPTLTLVGSPLGGVYSGTAVGTNGVVNIQDAAITINTKHTFNYTYSNSYGCADSTTKAIFVKPNVEAQITTQLDSVCKSTNSIILSGTPAGGVFSGTSINANGTLYISNPAIVANTSYVYNYTYTGAFGCKDTAYKTIFVTPAIATPTNITGIAVATQNMVYQYTTDSLPNTTYNWSINGGTLQQNNLNTITVLWTDTGIASIWVTCSNRCNTTSLNKIVQVSPAVGLAENNWLNEFSLFPNPATNQITVSFNASQPDMTLQVFNSTLQLVKTVALSPTNNQYNTTVSLDNLSSGLYFVKVGNSQYQHAVKVVVNK